MKYKNFFTILKYTLIVISIVYIYFNSKHNLKNVINEIELDLWVISFLIIIRLVLHNVLSLRTFFFLKLTSKYKPKLFEWNRLYFSTALINSMPSWGAGHFIRSFEMKMNHYSHTEYIGMYFFIYFWGILINSILMAGTMIFTDQQNFYIFSILIALFLISTLSISKKLLIIGNDIFKFFLTFKFLKEFKFLKYVSKKFLEMISISSKILLIRVFINFSFFTILTFFLQFYLFFSIFKYIFNFTDLNIILLLFLLNYLLKKVPSAESIIGIKETIFGIFAEQLGFIFIEGVLLSIILRLLNFISLVINYAFSFLTIKKSV